MKTDATKKLAGILAFAATSLSVVFGGLTLFLELQNVERRLVEFALREITMPMERMASAENKRSSDHMKAFIVSRAKAPDGHLIAIQLLSTTG